MLRQRPPSPPHHPTPSTPSHHHTTPTDSSVHGIISVACATDQNVLTHICNAFLMVVRPLPGVCQCKTAQLQSSPCTRVDSAAIMPRPQLCPDSYATIVPPQMCRRTCAPALWQTASVPNCNCARPGISLTTTTTTITGQVTSMLFKCPAQLGAWAGQSAIDHNKIAHFGGNL